MLLISSISKALVPILFCLVELFAYIDVLSCVEVFDRQSLLPRSCHSGLAAICGSNKSVWAWVGFKGVGPKHVYE